MPKYWGKHIFTHGRFPKWVISKRRREKEEENWEIPRSGSKAKDGEKKKEERAKVGDNNGQLRIATPPRVAHAKLPGPKH